jgi:hypothetical protein
MHLTSIQMDWTFVGEFGVSDSSSQQNLDQTSVGRREAYPDVKA